jgi:hypothetical protein
MHNRHRMNRQDSAGTHVYCRRHCHHHPHSNIIPQTQRHRLYYATVYTIYMP